MTPTPSTSPALPESREPIAFGEACQRLLAWARQRPLEAVLFVALLAGLVYFYGFYRVYNNGIESTALWSWRAWNAENDLEHGPVIFPIALFIVWYHREELRAAPKSSSMLGLVIAVVGAAFFVLAVRTLQARIGIISLPLLAYGSVLFLWGPKAARQILFPCVFLLFMIPAGFIVSRTVGLQNLAATVAAKLAGLVGIGVESDGVMLRALDGSFHFEVAGGCSGIRSLTAMTMLAALYVHFTQNELWKKAAVFASSLGFALLGNLVRIFTVVLFAKFIDPEIAAGLYHDYSGFIFFPIAVMGMVSFANLLNRDWKKTLAATLAPEGVPNAAAGSRAGIAGPGAAPAAANGDTPPSKPLTYDY